VLTEVRNAPRTLRKAAPIAVSLVTVFYVMANIAYVSDIHTKNETELRLLTAA